MRSLRRVALVAGVLYLITFVSSIPAVFLLAPVLSDPHYILGSGGDTRVLAGCFLDLINAVACIGTAVTLFPVVKRQNEGVALGFVTSRVFEAAIIVIGVVCLLAVVTLRRESVGVGPADQRVFLGIGRALVAVRNWTFTLGPSLIPGANALLLGYLLYASRLVPRLIPLLGLVGAPILIASAVVTLFRDNHSVPALAVIGTVPIFFWELSLGVWLVARGFRPSPIVAGMAEQLPA